MPPTPPPLPRLSPDRLLAWVGLFGSPTILLICLVLSIRLMPWMAYLLVASFIGGFAYLVVKMPRDTDTTPGTTALVSRAGSQTPGRSDLRNQPSPRCSRSCCRSC